MRLFLTVMALLAGVPASGYAQRQWERYKPGSLGGIVAAHAAGFAGDCDTVRPCTLISTTDFPTKAHVTFLGEVRPLPTETIHHIAGWARSLGMPAGSAEKFAQEVHIREDTLDLWIPIQSVLVDAFKREVPVGHGVSLLTLFTGAYVLKEAPAEWVFLINEFAGDH